MSQDHLRFIAAHGLPGVRTEPAPITGEHVAGLIAAAAAEKLVGLLDQAVADGALPTDAEASERIGEEAVRTQAWSLLVERHHLEVDRLLGDAGIDTCFLKGPTVAHRFYEHPALRTFVDVDVLVPGEAIDRAVGVLLAAGHTRNQPELTPGFSARYGKSVTMRSATGIEVDLHRVLASGPYGLVATPTPLWERLGAVDVGGTSLPALDPVAALVHGCVHAVTGTHVRLGSLRDIVQIGEGLDDHALADVRALADRLGVTGCVARAARLCAEALAPEQELLEGLESLPITGRDERWLGLYSQRTSYTALARAGLLAVPGIRAKAAYAASLARARRARRSWADVVGARPTDVG